MSAKIQFSWNNQKGFGLFLVFLGWALIFQIPAIFHSMLVLRLPVISEEYLLYLGVIIIVTTILGSLMASLYENFYDPVSERFSGVYSLLIFCFILFYLFYLLAVPFIEFIEPFLGIPRSLNIIGWNEFLISTFSGIIGVLLLYIYSERRKKQ